MYLLYQWTLLALNLKTHSGCLYRIHQPSLSKLLGDILPFICATVNIGLSFSCQLLCVF